MFLMKWMELKTQGLGSPECSFLPTVGLEIERMEIAA
jgi:hypothetical protein